MISRFVENIPTPNLLLGLAGLIPFWVLAFIGVFADASLSEIALKTQIAYGAVILSFLGGIHWGMAVKNLEEATWLRMSWGITLPLIGWGSLFISTIYALILLGLSLFVSLIVDLQFTIPKKEYSWFRVLRIILSAGAISALFFVILFIS